ncbi:hypothetical protein ABIC63_003938 [Pseudacidovorax sp. 1753]|uniref:O-antigen ligase family protein n=1 Tax=Pseudacidovorax sp. 1753 TaxID=3156419 RepID=UPI00339A4980
MSSNKFKYFLFTSSVLLLLTAGFWNWIFGSSALASWRQMLIVFLYAYSIKLLKTRGDLLIYMLMIIAQLVGIFFSALNGVSLYDSIYNIFFYAAWYPFFLFARAGFAERLFSRNTQFICVYLAICAAGLYIDFNTDIFNALTVRDYDNEFLEQIGAAKRAAFIFTTSTFVMLILGGVISVLLTYRANAKTLILSGAVGAVAVLCSGSLSANIIFMLVVAGGLLRVARRSPRALLVFLAVIFTVSLFVSTESVTVQRQLDRITSNEGREESNAARIGLWQYAVDLISTFSIPEHLLGKGLGTTNNRLSGGSLYKHGESSFFQAYIELGLLGVFLRFAPFLLWLRYWRATPVTLKFYGVGFFIAVLVAPTYGYATNQMILGTILGMCAKYARTNENSTKRYRQRDAWRASPHSTI